LDKDGVGETQEHERHWRVAELKVKVLYFAGAREIVAKREESMEIEDGASVDDFSAQLFKAHPGLGKLAGSVRFSVNLQVVSGRTAIRESDVLGVLPPVAGG
jgi:molybdopterin converting factor small subunit